jgi:hypothetical protein
MLLWGSVMLLGGVTGGVTPTVQLRESLRVTVPVYSLSLPTISSRQCIGLDLIRIGGQVS